MLDSKGFDLWADEYDQTVEFSSKCYPFDDYYDVLSYVYNQIEEKENKTILDVGFGTGLLTSKLYDAKAKIYGIDFSRKMIDLVKEKMPKGIFKEWDMNLGFPTDFQNLKFDYIISTYAFHHLTDDGKVQFIKELLLHLNDDGKIIIADISFETKDEMIKCKKQNEDKWDND